MSAYLSILAASGDDQIAKMIFGVIVAIIWGIGALVTQAKKKQKEQQGRQQHHENWSRIEQEMRERAVRAQSMLQQQPGMPPAPRPPPPPLPPPPTFAPTRSIQGPYVPPRPVQRAVQRPVQRPVQRQVQRPVQRAAQRQVQRPVQRVPAPVAPPPHRHKKQKAPPPPTQAAPPVPHMPAAVRADAARPATAGSHAATSASAAALSRWLNAKTLRSQFMLTEILQPPLALRDPDSQSRGL